MPESGKVVIAHPVAEWAAQQVAIRDDLPYFLSDLAPDLRTNAYVMDLDAIFDFTPEFLR